MANEKRLIDANALKAEHCEGCPYFSGFCENDGICGVIQLIDDAPTVDAVEVVRCKDCKHYDKDALWCDINSPQFSEVMYETCGDNRFEIIQRAKEDLIRSTNIEGSPDEMEVLDNILFRAWQMGWLDKYEPDYKERMKKEYWQLKDRYEKLHKMCTKYEAGTLDFTPTCDLGLLKSQKTAMGNYLHRLEVRAEIEGIKL